MGAAWRTFRVGLTGGIASGKSTVADMFAALGVPVLDTDVMAREVVQPGSPALAEITAAFGPAMLRPDGTLDRGRLRARVFADPEERRRLEAILHPRILALLEAAAGTAGGPYQLLVVPLLVEANLVDWVNRVLVVDCPASVQRERLMARDQESAEGVDRILAAQLPRDARRVHADDVIDSTGSLEDVRRQVATLHRKYLAEAAAAGK